MPDKYTVYSQQGFSCAWCDKAVSLLDDIGYPYELRALTRPELRKLAVQFNMSSIPIITKNDELIGGYTELDIYLKGYEKT